MKIGSKGLSRFKKWRKFVTHHIQIVRRIVRNEGNILKRPRLVTAQHMDEHWSDTDWPGEPIEDVIAVRSAMLDHIGSCAKIIDLDISTIFRCEKRPKRILIADECDGALCRWVRLRRLIAFIGQKRRPFIKERAESPRSNDRFRIHRIGKDAQWRQTKSLSTDMSALSSK